ISRTVAQGPISATATPANATNICGTDGALTITATGGDGLGKYHFYLNGPQTDSAFGSSPITFSGLQAGTYSVTVEDSASLVGSTALDFNNNHYEYVLGWWQGSGYGVYQQYTANKTGNLSQ